MTEFAFTQRPTSITELALGPEAMLQFCQANHVSADTTLDRCKAYTNAAATAANSSIINHINSLPANQRFAVVDIVRYAQEESIALAKFMYRYFTEDNMNRLNSFVGAASTAAAARLSSFEIKIVEYQTALKELWQLTRNNRHGRGPAAAKQQAKEKVRLAYEALEKAYATELEKYAPLAWRNKNRGDALSNAERGMTLASRNPNSSKLDPRLKVANRIEASWLGYCGKIMNVVGNAAVAVDAGLRVKEVYDIHDAGGDWMRESARQMVGFGLGGAAGIYAGKAVIAGGTWLAAASSLTLAGPLGWTVLGVIIGVGLLTGFTVGMTFDGIGKYSADLIWDLQR
ncbi:hypothetical protein [Halioxenophilus aromaticivorans]|uniref:Uncharacterized protein n=1 Tax=Halioxenophilus aromaticivorans TaxID=1306992 RepID=A0AAV3U1K6_9ALTE